MKAKVFFTIVAFSFFTGLLSSCETKDATETDTLYEINAIDKGDVEDPDTRGKG